jgi:hypothetical protein
MTYAQFALNQLSPHISSVDKVTGVPLFVVMGVVTVVRLRNAQTDVALVRLTKDTGALVGIFPSTEFYDHICPLLDSMNARTVMVGDYELTDRAFAIEQSMMVEQLNIPQGVTK